MKITNENFKTEKLKTSASLLSNNIEFIMNDLNIKQGLTPSGRLGNMIIYMVLPRYHRHQRGEGEQLITINSNLEKIALLKVMAKQSSFLVEDIGKRDPEFSKWVGNLLSKFLKLITTEWLMVSHHQMIRGGAI